MSAISRIKVGTFVQVVTKGSPNRRARVMGFTEKRVICQIMDKTSYIRNSEGEPKRFYVDPAKIKLYDKKAPKTPIASTEEAAAE